MPQTRWEYCAVDVTLYREGTGGETQEILYIKRPGTQRVGIANAYGAIGLLNQLGGEGWELVDVENGTFYLKREKTAGASAS